MENDFRGVKIDNCGLHNDMERYTNLMNATGTAFLTERSDQGHGTPINDPVGNQTAGWCPYNLFRSSGDIRANWTAVYRGNVVTRLGWDRAYGDKLPSFVTHRATIGYETDVFSVNLFADNIFDNYAVVSVANDRSRIG